MKAKQLFLAAALAVAGTVGAYAQFHVGTSNVATLKAAIALGSNITVDAGTYVEAEAIDVSQKQLSIVGAPGVVLTAQFIAPNPICATSASDAALSISGIKLKNSSFDLKRVKLTLEKSEMTGTGSGISIMELNPWQEYKILTVRNCKFNYASTKELISIRYEKPIGAANSQPVTALIENSLIAGNTAASTSSVIYSYGIKLDVVNSTLANNAGARLFGSSTNGSEGTLNLLNSVVKENIRLFAFSNKFNFHASSIDYKSIMAAMVTDGARSIDAVIDGIPATILNTTYPLADRIAAINALSFPYTTDADPKLSTDGQFTLSAGSPAINTGKASCTNSYNMHDYTILAPSTDYAGTTRPAAAIDMGYMESIFSACDNKFGAPQAAPLQSMFSSYDHAYTVGTGGPNLSAVANMTINWSLEQRGLWQLSMRLNAAPWYVNLGSASNTFAGSNPTVTIASSGIAGLDGAYYVTTHKGNLVLASTTSNFSIYCTNSTTTPDPCLKCDRSEAKIAAKALQGEIRIFPVPFKNQVNVQLSGNEATAISLMNTEGKILSTTDVTGQSQATIDAAGTANGTYFLEVHMSDGSSIISKLLK